MSDQHSIKPAFLLALALACGFLVTLSAAPPTRYEITALADPGAAAAARYQAWLGESHPGAGTLATVTATSRWI